MRHNIIVIVTPSSPPSLPPDTSGAAGGGKHITTVPRMLSPRGEGSHQEMTVVIIKVNQTVMLKNT